MKVAEMEDIKTLTESAKVASANLVTLLYFFFTEQFPLLPLLHKPEIMYL